MHFTLQCTPEEAFEALRSLNATSDDAEAALGELERDVQGRLFAFSLDWTKAGNRLHHTWDNTILSVTAQHREDWIDMRVPALGHLTPREAAETAAGRERLSVLLDHFDWQAEDGHPIPVGQLRRALGL